MRARTLKPLMALVLTVILVLIASMPAEAAWTKYDTIQEGHFLVIKDFVAQAGAGITYDVQVIGPSGARVDVLLMDDQNFALYESGGAFAYHSVSTLDFEFAHNDTEPGSLIDGMEYHLVIDNTDRPSGGALGSVEVSVEYYFGGYNIQALIDWMIVSAILLVVAVAAVAITYVSIILYRRLRGKGIL